ncbi:MAG: hypothetical protein QF662_01440, partial [Phycisphaerae bacterium]|nr:hypothetical protein [Phycisphaerae bacterium]
MAEDKPETAGEIADAAIELSPEVLHMADGCFERAEQAVQRGNFDYAIALYLEGIRYNPQDTGRGHRGLREVALKKAAQGGGAGFGALMKQMKATYYQMLGRHKDAMLALEAYLATKPNDVSALAAMMQSSRKNGYPAVAIWFGELAVGQTLKSKKPNKQLLITMAGLYEHGKQFRKAVDILSEAIRVDPGDRSLDKWLRDMSASGTIDDGKLDSVTDFHDMIRDKAQAAESASQKIVRTEEQFLQREKELRQELEQDPESYNAMG